MPITLPEPCATLLESAPGLLGLQSLLGGLAALPELLKIAPSHADNRRKDRSQNRAESQQTRLVEGQQTRLVEGQQTRLVQGQQIQLAGSQRSSDSNGCLCVCCQHVMAMRRTCHCWSLRVCLNPAVSIWGLCWSTPFGRDLLTV